MLRCLAAATIAAIALFAGAPDLRAASFDCNRAATGVETAICEDRGLSNLDEQMAQNYRALLNRTSGATESRIRSEQKNWLRQRNACGGDERCLDREYRGRIQNIAASGGAPAPRETAAVPNDEKPRGLFGGNARAPEPDETRVAKKVGPRVVQPAQTRAAKPVETRIAREAEGDADEERPGLLRRMITTMTPRFMRDREEREADARAQADAERLPERPLKIVGARPLAKTAPRAEDPLVAVAETPARKKSVERIEQQPQLAAPEPARKKSVRQEIEPQVATAREPERKTFVLRPAIEQTQVARPEPARAQLAAREEPNPRRKWEDLPTGSSLGNAEPTPRVTRTEPTREDDAPRVKTTRVKPESVEAPAPGEAPALTYVPENENEPPAQRILRQEPRVQMIKPLIVRDRPPATEPSAPAVMDEEPSAPATVNEEQPVPVDDTATASIAPESEPLMQETEPLAPEDNIPQLAALPSETSALPLDAETAPPASSPVREALKSRFDTAYGSPNRVDLLAPLRQTRHFDATRFDIFDEPAGG
jgi:uncharacterized protein YecT (DUF1311 family)